MLKYGYDRLSKRGNTMGIGKRLKEAREKAGLTQEELGKMIGVTGSSITNYEKETSHPKEPVIYALIDALEVEPNFLFQDCVHLPLKEKSPSTAEAVPGDGHISLEESNHLLVALGLIKDGQQLSDDDLAFLTHIVGLLETWFSKGQ